MRPGAEIQGITLGYAIIRNRTVEAGRYLLDRDIETLARLVQSGQLSTYLAGQD